LYIEDLLLFPHWGNWIIMEEKDQMHGEFPFDAGQRAKFTSFHSKYQI